MSLSYITNYIDNLQLWYKIVCIYIMVFVPLSFWYLEKKAYEEVKQLDQYKNNGDKISIDYIYLYITSLFYPILIALNLLTNFVTILIDVLQFIVSFIIDIIKLIFSIIIYLITLPFSKIKGGKNKNERTAKKDDKE